VEAGGYSSSGRTGIVVLAAKVESGGYSSSGRTGIVVLAAKVESGGYSSSGRTGIVVPPLFYWDTLTGIYLGLSPFPRRLEVGAFFH